MRGDGVELQVVGGGVRAAGGGRRYGVGGGAGVQPDAVQHAAGHHAVRVADGVQQRSERGAGAGEGGVLDNPDGEGRVGAGVGGGVREEPPRGAEHGAHAEYRGAPPPPLRPQSAGAGTPASSAQMN